MSQSVDSNLDFNFETELENLPRADQREIYTETAHGFSVREPVVLTASGWVKADAGEATHRFLLGGVVAAVPDVNTIIVTHKGVVDGYTGLTVEDTQYTSTTAGGVSTTWSNRQVGVAVSATQIFVGMGLPPNGGAGLIAKQTAASSSELVFDDIFTSDFQQYSVSFQSLRPATDNATFQFRLRDASGDIAGTHNSGYRVEQIGGGFSGRGTGDGLATNLGSAANETFDGELNLCPGSATHKRWTFSVIRTITDGTIFSNIGGGGLASTTIATGVRFFMASGNITSGTIEIHAM